MGCLGALTEGLTLQLCSDQTCPLLRHHMGKLLRVSYVAQVSPYSNSFIIVYIGARASQDGESATGAHIDSFTRLWSLFQLKIGWELPLCPSSENRPLNTSPDSKTRGPI
jgi:hypothetical protein